MIKMVLRPDQQRVCAMLKETITLMCKNGLSFDNHFCINAVIGVTLDDVDMFHVSMNEIVSSPASTQSSETNIDNGDRQLSSKRRRLSHLNAESDGSASESDDNNATFPADHSITQKAGGETQNLRTAMVKDESRSDGEDNSVDDLVFIKEEIDTNWSSSQIPSEHDENISAFRNILMPKNQLHKHQAQDHNISSLGMDLTSMSQPANLSVSYNVTSACRTSMTIPDLPHAGQVQSNSPVKGQGIPCPLCQKILVNSTGLKLHMNLHMGKYRYHCKVCQKGFMSATTLRGHMTKHTGVKEFKCPVCGSEFGHKYSFRKHMLSMHFDYTA